MHSTLINTGLCLIVSEMWRCWCISLASQERVGTFVLSCRVFVSNWRKPTVPTHSCQRYWIISSITQLHPLLSPWIKTINGECNEIYAISPGCSSDDQWVPLFVELCGSRETPGGPAGWIRWAFRGVWSRPFLDLNPSTSARPPHPFCNHWLPLLSHSAGQWS